MTEESNQAKTLGRAVARIQSAALALVCSLICGLGIFLMTVWLLVKGGEHVGPHLQLLSQYFIGYSVSWRGSLIGFFYGAILGGVVGWAIGQIYNRIVNLRHRS